MPEKNFIADEKQKKHLKVFVINFDVIAHASLAFD